MSYIIYSIWRIYYLWLNLREHDGEVIRKREQTYICRPIHFLMHDTPSLEHLPLTHEHCYRVCLYIRVPLVCGKYLYVHSTTRT